MPVPSVVVQQAVKNNLDADLAASLVSGSQIASVLMLLFFAATMNLASRPFLFPFCLLILAGFIASAGYFLDEYLSPSPHATFKGAIADKIDAVLDVIFKINPKREAEEEEVLSFDRKTSDGSNNISSDSDSNDGRSSNGGDENDAAEKNEGGSSGRGPDAPNARSSKRNERFLKKNVWPTRCEYVHAKLSLDSQLQRRRQRSNIKVFAAGTSVVRETKATRGFATRRTSSLQVPFVATLSPRPSSLLFL
jgi:hypothetical protein